MPLAEKGVRGKGRQPFPRLGTQRSRRASARRLCATAPFTHGIPAHFDAMSVVNQPVQDAIGGGGIADLLMPMGNRHLRG